MSGRTGAKLAAFCGLEEDEFLFSFDRVNLIRRFPGKTGKGDAFPLAIARRRALALSRAFAGRTAVLLGANVSSAFLLAPAPLFRWRRGALGAARLAIAPHPSGVSRWWNEPENATAAARFFRRLARESIRGP